MLKSYAVEDLQVGMTLGREVKDMMTQSLILPAGHELSGEDIRLLTNNNIFTVFVEEGIKKSMGNVPGGEFLLDEDYVKKYDLLSLRMQEIFTLWRKEERIEVDKFYQIVSDQFLLPLCVGAKAVSQIHNMSKRGDYLVNHSLHVAILAGLMGEWLRWPKKEREDLIIAGLVHDIGKLKVPEEILEKTGKLTDEEFRQIKKHPEHSYDMLKLTKLGKNRPVMMGIAQHHERTDGSGYPAKLKGDAIEPIARILAILDIYDAMAADRAYARRNSPFDVFGVLYEDILRGKLDTEYGVLFLKNLCHSLNGNWVWLSSGDKARIVYIDDSRVTSLPVVQTAGGEFIDLNRRSDVKITSLLTAQEV
ncbi:MAG: HD-GYP domain-containing protein [Selenomonadaceae bacterium]|nr:HD-GYP domain-containing protein [Selenomonadaceae bacterium]